MALGRWLSKEFIMLLPRIFVYFPLSTLNGPQLCVTPAPGELLRTPTFMNMHPPTHTHRHTHSSKQLKIAKIGTRDMAQ